MNILIGNVKKIAKAIVEKDLDYFLAIEGYERVGKSSVALKLATEIDPTFDVEQVVFDIDQLYDLVYKLDKGKCVIIDEGATAFFSREAMKESTREGVKLLTVMGERNLFVIICVPSFGILDKYLREHRISTVVKVTKRGWLKVYGPRKVRRIQWDARFKKWMYPAADIAEKCFPFTGKIWSTYKEKKSEYLSKRRNGAMMYLNKNQGSRHLGINKSTFKEWEDKGYLTPDGPGGKGYSKKALDIGKQNRDSVRSPHSRP